MNHNSSFCRHWNHFNFIRFFLRCKCISALGDKSTLATPSSTGLQRIAYSRIHATSASSCTTESDVMSNCACPFLLLRLVGFSSVRCRSAPKLRPGITRLRWTAVPSLRHPPLPIRPCLICHSRQPVTMSGSTPEQQIKPTVTDINKQGVAIFAPFSVSLSSFISLNQNSKSHRNFLSLHYIFAYFNFV